jgi:DNA-binding transcriptional ArsR family regulator
MTNYAEQAYKLKIMGHPIRLEILQILRCGETCVCHLEHAIGRRQAYISQQLMALRDASLVEARKDGVQVYYHLADIEVASLLESLYGAKATTKLALLDECPCPNCSPQVEKQS